MISKEKYKKYISELVKNDASNDNFKYMKKNMVV